jgi:FG-GAP-like repeat
MEQANSRRILLLFAVLLGVAAFETQPTAQLPNLLISEFRLRGPSGANDEFIEIHNPRSSALTVSAASGTGYGVAASDGTTRCSIPNGTVIPARGHYLCANSVAYSLGSYPAGNSTTATGNATYTTDIPDNAGIALFNNNTGGGSYTLANRFDAVGSTSEANTLYKEGSGYPALTPFSIDYSFYRDTTSGFPKDTNNNAVDFVFVDTNGTSAGAGQRLGAPGPQNLSAPVQTGSGLTVSLLDPIAGVSGVPNLERDFTSDPANNSTFGTITVRRKVTNNTGVNVTRLRLRYAFINTFPSPSGVADLRPRTSSSGSVEVSGGGTVAVSGTTLEQPPSQPNGSGFNGSMGVGSVSLGSPLAPGASVNLQLLHGIQQTGLFLMTLNVEALPGGGTFAHQVGGHTETSCLSALSPMSTVFGPAGGNSTIDVFAPSGCAWAVSQTPAFAVVNGGSSGLGAGITAYSVAGGNLRLRRRANFVISNAVASVTQLGTVPSDFELDGRADPVVYRPSSGQWWINRSIYAYSDSTLVTWGTPGDTPTPADFDGDGKSDPAVYRPAGGGNSHWFVKTSSTGYAGSYAVHWGTSGDVPVPGYYDNDALADPAVYRPSTGQWFIARSIGGYTTSYGFVFGVSADTPVPADYDGDGRTDAAIYRPSTGQWFVARSDSDFTQSFAVPWGVSTDTPVAADYDGDGKADPAVFRPSTGQWLIRRSSTGYFDSLAFTWGTSTDMPMPADFDGDGRADPTIYRPSTGQWFILRSTSNYTAFTAVLWGSGSDVPIREK